MSRENEFEWNQFIRLGDMIGDGMHYEDPWITKEYKRLAKILIPPTKEEKEILAQARKEKNQKIDDAIKAKEDKCSKCSSPLVQKRSGSYIVKCVNIDCGAEFKYKTKKK